jgi:hypothetical protein
MGGATSSAEAQMSEGASNIHHVLDNGDGFREGLNPSYDLLVRAQESIVPQSSLRSGFRVRSLHSRPGMTMAQAIAVHLTRIS